MRRREFIVDYEHMTVLYGDTVTGRKLPYTFRNVPHDAVLVNTIHRPEHMGYGLVFEHPDFPEVAEGVELPFEAMQWQK